jgi:TPR repeat protein
MKKFLNKILQRKIHPASATLFVIAILIHNYTKDEGMDAYKDKRYDLAHKVWMASAEKDDALAQYNIGMLYNTQSFHLSSKEKAYKWYKKSANLGYAPALLSLGDFYQNGIVVDKNTAKAIELYKKSAKQENPDSFGVLAELYFQEKDYKNAKKWLIKINRRGDGTAYTFYKLGYIYENGFDVKINKNKAIQMYESAAERGLFKHNLN